MEFPTGEVKEAVPKYINGAIPLIEEYICPFCSNPVELSHEDDVGTKFYKCTKCSQYCTNPKSPERKALEESLAKTPIQLYGEHSTFTAQASDGFIEHMSGFFRRHEDKFIIAELTLLRGLEQTYETKKNPGKTFTNIRSLLVYNRNGDRGYHARMDEHIVDFNGRQIVLEGSTLRTSLETLMSYETVTDFLHGRNEDLKTLFYDLLERNKKFVNLDWDPRLYLLIPCIQIATYFFDVFNAFPIIFIYGPFETGKSRLVKTIVYVSRKGLLWVSPTPAPIYRTINAIRPTIGIDEFTKVYEELMQLTRAIYKKGLLVPRMERSSKNQKMFLTFFETYTPLVLGSTRELEPMVMSRAIVIHMRKAEDPNPAKSDPEPWDFEDLRDRLYITRLTYADRIDELRRELDKKCVLKGREYEIWRPILSIAKFVDEKVYEDLLKLAEEISKQKYEGLYIEEKDILLALNKMFGLNSQVTLDSKDRALNFYPKEVSDTLFSLKSEQYGYTGQFQSLDDENKALRLDSQEARDARRKFDEDYKPRKIGWILKRLGLKFKHKAKGNEYSITNSDLRDLATRFRFNLEDK